MRSQLVRPISPPTHAAWLLRFAAEPVYGRESPALFVLAFFSLVIVTGVVGQWIGYRGKELNTGLEFFVVLWTIGHLAQSFHAKFFPDICKIIALFFLVSSTAPLAGAVLAGSNFPLADATLSEFDRLLFPGLYWPDMARAFNRYPSLMKLLCHAYVSLGWQPPLLIIMLCTLNQTRHCWNFVSCWAASLLVTIAIFPLLPAVGPYSYFGITEEMMPAILCGSAWHYPITLQHLRDGSISDLGANVLEGIVAMPSFHAASAVLLFWFYGKLAYLRWPFWTLNFFMWMSAVPVGGHYLVDVVAGTAIALCAIYQVERCGPSDGALPIR